MSVQGLEHFLARLYTDAELRDRFLADARATIVAEDAPLTEDEREALAAIDLDGLVLAARSYERKREGRRERRAPGWLERLGLGRR